MVSILRGLLITAVLLAFSPTLKAQGTTRSEILQAPDGFPIHITYYPFKQSDDSAGQSPENAPVVILLPGDGEDRLFWDKNSIPSSNRNIRDPLPVFLQKQGYVVITVDLRKHGESKVPGNESSLQPADYQAMVLGDMVAVKKFIFDEHQKRQLNMNKLGIVAVESSAPVAAAFAELDWKQTPYDDAPVLANRTPRGQDVQAISLLSPASSAGRLRATRSLMFLRNPQFDIALQVIVGSEDRDDKGQAKDLYDAFERSNRGAERIEILTPNYKDRGLELIQRGQGEVYVAILQFLDTHVKDHLSQWRDRRSALER